MFLIGLIIGIFCTVAIITMCVSSKFNDMEMEIEYWKSKAEDGENVN